MKYKIYQISESSNAKYLFSPWKRAADVFKLSDYKAVYEGDSIDCKNGVSCTDCDTALEILFTTFNIDRPADFEGHSLSVSDVVELREDGVSTFYYCDVFGWMRLDSLTR